MTENRSLAPASEAPPPARARRQSETAQVLDMIARAAADPQCDIDKMERLMRMRREMVADQAERAFNVAMKDAQKEMRPIAADAENKQTSSRYATYAQLDRALRPIYTEHGFALSFDEEESPKPDHIRVVCYVSHDDGHTRKYRKDMPADGKGAKGGDVMTKTHAAGAAASYGARYLLKGIFNVSVGEDDRDGNKVEGPSGFATPPQIAELRKLIDAFDADEAKVVSFVTNSDATTLEELPAKLFAKTKAELNAYGARMRSEGKV